MHTYICFYREVCLSSRGFLSGVFCPGVFCLEAFVRGGFCPSPFLSEYIRYNRKLNITFNFKFETCDVTCSCTLSPVTNCYTFSEPLPLERDVLYGSIRTL